MRQNQMQQDQAQQEQVDFNRLLKRSAACYLISSFIKLAVFYDASTLDAKKLITYTAAILTSLALLGRSRWREPLSNERAGKLYFFVLAYGFIHIFSINPRVSSLDGRGQVAALFSAVLSAALIRMAYRPQERQPEMQHAAR